MMGMPACISRSERTKFVSVTAFFILVLPSPSRGWVNLVVNLMVVMAHPVLRCKASKQLEDPALTAAAAAAVAEAEAEERALAAALEAIARLPPRPGRPGPRRSLCVEVGQNSLNIAAAHQPGLYRLRASSEKFRLTAKLPLAKRDYYYYYYHSIGF